MTTRGAQQSGCLRKVVVYRRSQGNMLKLNCIMLLHKVIALQAKIREIDNWQIERQTVETLYIAFCIYRSYYSSVFCTSTAITCQQAWSWLLKTELVLTFEQWLFYNNHTWSCLVVAYRKPKQNSVSNPGLKRGRRHLKYLRSEHLQESFWNSI